VKGIPSGACSIKAKARRFITLIIFFGFGIPLWQCIFIFEFVNFCEDVEAINQKLFKVVLKVRGAISKVVWLALKCG